MLLLPLLLLPHLLPLLLLWLLCLLLQDWSNAMAAGWLLQAASRHCCAAWLHALYWLPAWTLASGSMLLRLLRVWLLHASPLRSQLVLSCDLLSSRCIAGSSIIAVCAVCAAAGLHSQLQLLAPDMLGCLHQLLPAGMKHVVILCM